MAIVLNKLKQWLLALLRRFARGRYWGHLGWSAVKGAIRSKFPHVRHISPSSLAAWLERPEAEQPILLDTRTFEEYAVSHLSGAKLVNPTQQDFTDLNLPHSDAQIVTYCSVGYRSAAIAERLQAAGYRNVMNLEGSIFQWANEGRPVYHHGEAVQQVHPYNAFWGRLLNQKLHADSPQSGASIAQDKIV